MNLILKQRKLEFPRNIKKFNKRNTKKINNNKNLII